MTIWGDAWRELKKTPLANVAKAIVDAVAWLKKGRPPKQGGKS